MQANKQVSFFSAGEVPMFIQVKDRLLKKKVCEHLFFFLFSMDASISPKF